MGAGNQMISPGFADHRLPWDDLDSGNSNSRGENMANRFLNKNVSEKKYNMYDTAYQRIQHQMQANFEIRINAIKKANNEALVKAKQLQQLHLLNQIKMYRTELEINIS